MGPKERDATGFYRFRKRADHRKFLVACAISAVFHLSMVTVFSIVIYFPRQDIVFRDFSIVPVAVPDPRGPEPAETAEDAGTPPGGQLALRDPMRGGAFPAIQLPTLEFAELERLRVRQESIESFSRYDALFQEPEQDSWSRFSRSLSGLSRTLSELRLSGEESPGGLAMGDVEPARATHRPAEGFEAIILWAGGPRDRELLFAPPVEALWRAEPGDLDRPIEVVMQVNALGRVVNVFSPNLDDRELVDAVQLTALQYRFEPLALDDATMQTATLRIQRERPEPAP